MAKIQFDLQISSYSGGHTLFQSDSNWLFTTAIAEALEKLGHQTSCLIGTNWKKPVGPVPFSNVGFIRYRNTEEDRFFIDRKIYNETKIWKPDIIWTNDPCRVGAYRTFFDGPIIAYNHWIDNPIDQKMPPKKTYYWRQAEAYYKADYLLFNSQFGINFFRSGLHEYIYPYADEPYKPAKLGAVNPPLKTDLIWSILGDRPYLSTTPTLAFNHRLSSAPQYKENIELFEEILDILAQNGFQCQVLVSNPSGKDHPLLHRPNVRNIHSQNYEAYLAELSQAWFQLTLFKYPGQWSMAMAEALALGIEVIAPAHSGYAEMSRWPTRAPRSTLDIAEFIWMNYQEYSERDFGQANYHLEQYSAVNIVEKQLIPLVKELQ